jgi:hypothetical protein
MVDDKVDEPVRRFNLQSVSVEGLFGIFNHTVEFLSSEGITIITAPNGYGKTALLRMISIFFRGGFQEYRTIKFKSFTLNFTGNVRIVIERDTTIRNAQRDLLSDEVETQKRRPTLQMFVHEPERQSSESWTIATYSPRLQHLIERRVPWVRRIGPDLFLDRRTGESITTADVIDRYPDTLPEIPGAPTKEPKLSAEIRKSINCTFIETQRLWRLKVTQSNQGPSGQSDDAARATVSKLHRLSRFTSNRRTI